jgi:hypothetical protein
MTAGVAVPPEHPERQTHPDSGDGGSGDGGGKNGVSGGSSTGSVETKSHGTKVPCSSRTYEHAKAKVMWKDTLFPRRHPTSSPSPCTAK